ncbi:MAG: hypothetical protein M1543_02250 [Firmicutes bacterium]|nr:hypothetical protein [Bacillota bacterium]
MSRTTTYEHELTILEKGACVTTIEPQELLPRQSGVFCISPGTWVEDPITGEREKIKYWYKAASPVCCPTCDLELPAATFIKTKKHIILFCELCHTYTWLRIVR